VIAAVDTCGWVVGHLYGGVLTRYFDWRMIFWLNLPVCLVAFILIYFFLRRLPQTPGEGRMDWPGAVLVSASLTALMLGLGSSASGSSLAQNSTSTSGQFSLPLLVLAVLLLALFILYQLRTRYPLLPLALFRRANFVLSGLANLLIGFALFIAIANVPIFINTLVAQTLVQGAWDSGWVLSALTIPMAIASVPGGWLATRLGYRWPAVVGLAAAIAGFALMSTWIASTSYLSMVPQLVLAGIGFGLTLAPIAAAAINTASASFRGSASAFVIIFRLVGMTVSVASIAAFDQLRFNRLSASLLAVNNDLAKAGMDAITTVIHETFWMAVIICGLACVPILFLHSEESVK
jgi:MFS family permease